MALPNVQPVNQFFDFIAPNRPEEKLRRFSTTIKGEADGGGE
jgi:hypothetical protein